MNDGATRGHSVETRLAVLEGDLRRIDLRLSEVSARTHTLVSSVASLAHAAEEAVEQRTALIEKVDDIQGTINTLNTAAVLSVREMSYHVGVCDKRGLRLEKLGWSVLSILVPIMGFLLVAYLTHLGAK